MKIGAVASGAVIFSHPKGDLPLMPLFCAPETADRHLEVASLHPNRLPLDQGLSHFPSRRIQNPLEGGTRDMHPVSTLLLVEAFQVLKPNRFRLFDGQDHLLEAPSGYPYGSKKGYLRERLHTPIFYRSWHNITSLDSKPCEDQQCEQVLASRTRGDTLCRSHSKESRLQQTETRR